MQKQAAVAMKGDLGLRILRRPGFPAIHHPTISRPSVSQVLALGLPRLGLPDEVNLWRARNFPNLWRGIRDVRAASKFRGPSMIGFLHLAKIDRQGQVLDLGLAGARVVTTAFVNLLVDAFQDAGASLSTEFVFHGIGTGGAAEAVGNTALTTELTTQYSTDNVRPTGSNTEAAANVYRSVGTVTVDAIVAITEHGLFNSATVGAGVLMDRTLFSVVNLASGESIQATYDLTVSAGG